MLPYTSSVEIWTKRLTPRLEGALQKRVRAENVGPHEPPRLEDRAVDVRLRGEIVYDVDAGKQSVEEPRVADVPADESKSLFAP